MSVNDMIFAFLSSFLSCLVSFTSSNTVFLLNLLFRFTFLHTAFVTLKFAYVHLNTKMRADSTCFSNQSHYFFSLLSLSML